MKIFVSWSGIRSLGVAMALKEWLPDIFNGISLFVSSEDIRKGKRWPAEVATELEACNFGIVCLTQDNLEAPWLLFEAGALSKSVKVASVYTLLLDGLRTSDIDGPLSHFQHTIFEKADFFKLVKSINDARTEGKQDEARLNRIFDKFWGDLESKVSTAINTNSKPIKNRSVEDMLRELLDLTSHIARNTPDIRIEKSNQAASRKQKLAHDELWPAFVEKVGKENAFVKTYFAEAIGFMSPDGKAFVIEFKAEFSDLLPLVDNPRNHALAKRVLAELGFPDCNIQFCVERF